MLRSSLPGIGLSAAVVAVSLAIYGATQDGGRGPAPTAVGGASADVTLPRPLAASGPFGPQPVAGVPGGGDDGQAPLGGGGVFVPVVFDPQATLPVAPQPVGGGQRRDGGDRPDRRPGKRGNQRGTDRHGGNERSETVRPATPAPQQPAQPQRPAPQRPDPPKRPVDPPVKAGTPHAPGLLKKPGQLPPGQAKKQAAPAPAPVAPVAPAPKPSRPAKPAKPVVPPGQAKKQAPVPAAPPAAAPAPAAPPASGCAPAGNGQGKANGRC
ncbi:MAG TPA: hypothetical protein VD836_13015 [Solirubrobacteraceae bacterium]|nr:hypothetical protein [Solirubrobacteraceae bacterium]